MDNLSVICFARKNSKRFPGKNIHPLNGKPLIQYTIDTMLYMRKFTFCKTVVFTDFKECYQIAKDNGILCIIDQEKCNYDDMRLHYWAHGLFNTPNYVLLQATNPIRNNHKIMEWTNFCINESHLDSAFSVYKTSPGNYVMNGNFYYYNYKQLLNKSIYDNNSLIFQDDYFFDIDTKEDLIKTEEFLKNANKNNS